MGFGKWIRTRREAAAITLNDFSRRLDISPAYWSRIEREMEKPPKDELIEKAVQALGLSLDQAFIRPAGFRRICSVTSPPRCMPTGRTNNGRTKTE